MKRKLVIFSLMALVAFAGIAIFGCSISKKVETPAQPEKPAKGTLLLATTTSTVDTGILDVLIPKFEKESGYKMKYFSVGSGEAMKMGERGDVDVLLVHSKDAEEEFMAKGFGFSRQKVMHNDYVIVGPAGDPAHIAGIKTGPKAFGAVASSKSTFVSRGDDSGTNKKELKLWDKAGIKPKESWYLESGQGMGETLRIADEKQGYTLSDRGTFLVTKSNLTILVEKDKSLLNPYSVIVINRDKFPKVHFEAAKDFAAFITYPEVQKIIGGFGVEKFGQPLFVPDAK